VVAVSLDPANDASNGFDITAMDIWSIADQVQFGLQFSKIFDPTRAMLYPGPRGELWIDGDRSLATGAFPMGAQIATWGADRLLFFDIGSMMTNTAVVHLVTDGAGSTVVFGQGRNDGRWLVQGNVLYLNGAASLFDGATLVSDGIKDIAGRRPSDGTMYVQANTLEPTFARTSDILPNATTVIDTLLGAVKQPLAWGPGRVSSTDAREYGMVSGFDVTALDAEAMQNHLVVKASLSAWLNTDIDNVFDLYLDLDGNAATAPFGVI
jgi:hypothetical protein